MGNCRPCQAEREANRDLSKRAARDRKRDATPKRQAQKRARRAQYKAGPAGKAANARYWASDKGKGTRNAITAHRRAAIIRATPEWADVNAVRAIYQTCPPGFHVDHIAPLRGKTVCGLHVPWNLQYLPALENMRKNAKFP